MTEAPAAPLIIQTFVAEVSIEPGPSPVTEGADVTFTLTRNGPLTAELTVNVSVTETGSMLSGALSASATFAVGADTTTLTLTTEDDAPIEDPSTVTVTIEAGARYQAAPGAATADAVVLDDLPRFLLKVGPAEVTEGGGGAVTVEIDNGVSLATAQTISLALSGTATADDFTLLNTSDRTLSAPYTLTIPANGSVAAAYITTTNDALAEPDETLTITASHDGTEIGTGTMTLRASSLRLELSSLTASGGGRAMYPSFDSGTLHYAVGCDPSQTLTLRLIDHGRHDAARGQRGPAGQSECGRQPGPARRRRRHPDQPEQRRRRQHDLRCALHEQQRSVHWGGEAAGKCDRTDSRQRECGGRDSRRRRSLAGHRRQRRAQGPPPRR